MKLSFFLPAGWNAQDAASSVFEFFGDIRRRSAMTIQAAVQSITDESNGSSIVSNDSHGDVKILPRRKRPGKDLSLLHTLPFDPLFEILVRLSARDVVAVARVSKEWFDLLYSQPFVSVWRNIHRQEDIPEPHPDMSEFSWIYLMYSGNRCECCGTRGVRAVDFGIRRRVCNKCKKENLVSSKDLARMFPEYESIVFTLVPATTHIGSPTTRQKPGATRYHWISDIHKIGRAWNALQQDVERGKWAAAVKLEAFRTKRELRCQIIEEGSELCNRWYLGILEKRVDARQDAARKRKEAIFDRFRARGYSDEVLQHIRWNKAVNQPRELTDRIWTRIRWPLEVILMREKERCTRDKCTRHLTEGYDEYVMNLPPRDRISVPDISELVDFYVHSPVPIYIEDAQDETHRAIASIESISFVINHLQETFKRSLREVVEAYNFDFYMNHVNGDVDLLDLAMCSFACLGTECERQEHIFGWKEAMWHTGPKCKKDGKTEFIACKSSNRLQRKLIALAKLNPETAKSADMDALDLRFLCKVCEGRSFVSDRLHGVQAFTWREALNHKCDSRDDGIYNDTEWRLLPSNEYKHLIESPHISMSGVVQNNYICNRCYALPHWHGGGGSREVVEEHLRERHHIYRPLFPRDYFFHPQEVIPMKYMLQVWNKPVNKPEGWFDHGRFVCKSCPRSGRYACFRLDQMVKHSNLRHGKQTPVGGKDYFERIHWCGYMPAPEPL